MFIRRRVPGQASRALARENKVFLNKVDLQGKVISQSSNGQNKVIDGFVRSGAASSSPSKPRRIAAAHKLHHRTEKAHTLMRGALKKPPVQMSGRIQKLTPGYNPEREAHAKSTSRHSHVQRFGIPKAPAGTGPRPPLKAKVTPKYSPSAAPPASTSVALPSMVTSASHQKLERMLDVALTRADAHKQALRYHAARHFWQRPGFLGRRTGLKLSLIVVLVLVAGGFAAWQKFPQLSIKLAAAKAHITASVPSYKPEGYSLAAPAQAINGQVLIKYKAVSDASQGYDITQQPSDMTSTSLANTLAPGGAQMQTSQVGGNTVYIYGSDNNAAWVNNGVLYKLSDHAHLSSDEILNIVKGLN